jgi:hypothetical protein
MSLKDQHTCSLTSDFLFAIFGLCSRLSWGALVASRMLLIVVDDDRIRIVVSPSLFKEMSVCGLLLSYA